MNQLSVSLSHIPRLVTRCVRSLRTARQALPESTTRKRRVLLVDDESGLTTICKIMLEQTGLFVVRVENHGERALSVAQSFRPDVIFLDIYLPDKDGHAISADLQADPHLKDVPIVFWSGSVHRKAIVTNSHGSWPALSKPFSSADLTQLATNPAA